MPVELAEAAAEIDVLLARDVLIAKEQDAVIEKRAVDFPERSLAHRFTDVDVQNFGAQRIRKAAQVKCHGVLLHSLPQDCRMRTAISEPGRRLSAMSTMIAMKRAMVNRYHAAENRMP